MGQDRGAAQVLHGVTDKQLWFRGMSAIMDEMNGLDIRNDYEHDENEEEKDRFRTSLEEEWRIHNKEELLSALEWIREGGHRVAFEQMRTFMNALSEADQWKCIHSLNPETGRYHEYLVVKTYMYKLPPAGIAAWDWGRYANLCRKSAYVGFITEVEAEQFILEAALEAQSAYSSWKEYAVAFLAGRLYWLEQTAEPLVQRQINYVRNLFVQSNSIYNKVDWNLNLSLQ